MNLMKIVELQRGRGKGRQPREIRAFLALQGLTMSDVARMAKTYPHIAQETIRGVKNHHRVLRVLEQLGCPEKSLYGEREREAA